MKSPPIFFVKKVGGPCKEVDEFNHFIYVNFCFETVNFFRTSMNSKILFSHVIFYVWHHG